MQLDIGATFAEVATPGIPESAFGRLDRQIGTVHRTIMTSRDEGTFGYAALDPTPPVSAVRDTAARFPDASTLLIVGIGGSALPAGALTTPLLDPDSLEVRLLDTADPHSFERAVRDVELDSTVINIVSRSGRTAETLANFRELRARFDATDTTWADRTVVTTGPDGPLREIATERGLPTLPAPADAPGRFGIFSPVGLFPLALGGGDVDGVLAGAKERVGDLDGSLHTTPAYAMAATTFALARRGADTIVLWPYADELRPMTEWAAQLFAESLGKDGLGITPIRARGPTDQHAHLQLYRAGPRDKVALFLEVDRKGPPARSDGMRVGPESLAGAGLAELQRASARGTAASLVNDGRPVLRGVLPDLSAQSLGALAVDLMVTTIAVGELMDVDAFDQPAVEWGKRATRGLLGDPDCAAEASAAADLPSHRIG